MKAHAKYRFDAFTFSLGGVSVASSHTSIPVVANDRIARAWDERLGAAKPLFSNRPRFAELSAECS